MVNAVSSAMSGFELIISQKQWQRCLGASSFAGRHLRQVETTLRAVNQALALVGASEDTVATDWQAK